jgi:hypothetical protein
MIYMVKATATALVRALVTGFAAYVQAMVLSATVTEVVTEA